MTELVIGIDGGQTSSQCALATSAGQILGLGKGGPLVHFAVEGSRKLFVVSLQEAVQAAWTAAGLTPRAVDVAALGLTGVEAGTPEATTALELLPQVLQARSVEVQNDAVAALFGAHLGKPGVIVIAGTGSIALGMGIDRQIARVGGWGWLVGDEGSAAVIGRNAVAAAFRSLDGTGPKTLLEDALAKHFGLSQTRDLKRLVYASDFGARGFAALAMLVSEVAERKDELAQKIIAQTASDLAHSVVVLVSKLAFGDQAVRIAPVGGAFTYVHGLRESFAHLVQQQSSAFQVVDAVLAPVFGAVIMALGQCSTSAPDAEMRVKRILTERHEDYVNPD
jgi:glucosamine kinase